MITDIHKQLSLTDTPTTLEYEGTPEEARFLADKLTVATPAAYTSDKDSFKWREANVQQKDGYGMVWINV